MKSTIAAVLASALALGLTCIAETVELKTGERNEGTVKAITAEEVVLQVAGQPLKFPRENVSAIYFAAPPTSTAANPLNDALRVLKGLQSATGGGVSYSDYAPRVTDAKIQVDRLLGDAPDGPAKTALAEALGFYVYASNAWNADITPVNIGSRAQYETLARNPLFEKCEALKRVLARSKGSNSTQLKGISISMLGVQPLLECASEHVDAAERLVHGK